MSTDWGAFAVVMARALSALADDDHLEVAPDGSGRYVQVLRYGDRFRAEVASNRYLDASERWTDDDEATLRRVGWNAPGDGEHQGPNWHVDLGVDLLADVVELIRETLRRAHGVVRIDDLAIGGPAAVLDVVSNP